MERANKQVGSSFAVDLFGPKDLSSSSPSPNSSEGFFGSIFGPHASMVPGRDPSPNDDCANAYGNSKLETHTDHKSVKGNSVRKGVNSSYDEKGRTVEPCYYNSSIYYGGQELYSPTSKNANPPQNFKKDGGKADQNESSASDASRGNWWQGSLYY